MGLPASPVVLTPMTPDIAKPFHPHYSGRERCGRATARCARGPSPRDRSRRDQDSAARRYASTMPFSRDDLDAIDREGDPDRDLRGLDGRSTASIWSVVDGDAVFVRSWRGVTARWYREALANGDRHPCRKRRLPARAVRRGMPSVSRTSAELERKYEGDPAAHSMVRDRSGHHPAGPGGRLAATPAPTRNLRRLPFRPTIRVNQCISTSSSTSCPISTRPRPRTG